MLGLVAIRGLGAKMVARAGFGAGLASKYENFGIVRIGAGIRRGWAILTQGR